MANEVYIREGTILRLNGASGADYAFGVHGLTNGAGRVSAQIDLGASPRPAWFMWACEVQFQATPTQGKSLELYRGAALSGFNTQVDGDTGTSDAAMGDADMRRNLKGIGQCVSENSAASEKCNASGWFFHPFRYLIIAAYNDSGATVNATDSNFVFRLMPFYPQGQ